MSGSFDSTWRNADFGVGELLLLVEHGAQLESDRGVAGKLRLRVLQDLHGLGAALGVGVQLRQRDVRLGPVRLLLDEFLQHDDRLVGLAALTQGLRLEPRETQVVGVLRAAFPRDVDRSGEFLGGQVSPARGTP